MFQPRQYTLWLQAWLSPLWPVVAVGIVGTMLAVLAWMRADGRYRAGLEALFVATICSAPLTLLVIALGEPPRNLLAQIEKLKLPVERIIPIHLPGDNRKVTLQELKWSAGKQ